MWLIPNFTTTGFLLSTSLPAASASAIPAIKNEDKLEFSKLVEAIKASYNDVFTKTSRTWGGGIMGVKSQAKTAARERVLARELAQRATVKA